MYKSLLIILILITSTIYAECEDNHYSLHVDTVSEDGSLVTLDDGSQWEVSWWYKGVDREWKKQDQVFIEWSSSYPGDYLIIHEPTKGQVWAKNKKISDDSHKLTIKGIPNSTANPHAYQELILSNELKFRSPFKQAFGTSEWKVGHNVYLLPNRNQLYQIINFNTYVIASKCTQASGASKDKLITFDIEKILNLENTLNRSVIQQPLATYTVAISMINYAAGLKEKEKPVGVFLFLGPTGVGKTELAKALCRELYETENKLIRFDMSHFNEPHSSARLIGSPPGYVNHEEGGQLTEPIKDKRQGIVLLDEMEKAHEQVRKAFLPVFDEGFILDNKNNKIDCSEMIFIMTSNLCGLDIAKLVDKGYTDDQILEHIQPKLMQALSPELYNRVEPVLFHPLDYDAMNQVVNIMLNKIKKRIYQEKEIELVFDSSLKEYLIDNGYNPVLGARPLKRLIDKELVKTIALEVIYNHIGKGDVVYLYYDQDKGIYLEK